MSIGSAFLFGYFAAIGTMLLGMAAEKLSQKGKRLDKQAKKSRKTSWEDGKELEYYGKERYGGNRIKKLGRG